MWFGSFQKTEKEYPIPQHYVIFKIFQSFHRWMARLSSQLQISTAEIRFVISPTVGATCTLRKSVNSGIP